MKFYILLVGLVFAGVSQCAKRKAQGKMTYTLNWVNGMAPCEDFENEHIMIDMSLEKDTPMTTVLTGKVEITKPVIEDTVIVILVHKDTPQGKVLAYTMEVPNLCDHVSEEGMPWSIFFDAMKLDPRACPLPPKVYPMEDLKLNLGFADKIMNHDTVGEYVARIELTHKGDGLDVLEHDIACYKLGFSVDESREEKSDDGDGE